MKDHDRRIARLEGRATPDELVHDLKIVVADVYVTRAEAVAIGQKNTRSREPESMTDLHLHVVHVLDDEPSGRLPS